MNYIESYGNTFISLCFRGGSPFTLSIISERAWCFVRRRSKLNRWDNIVLEYERPFEIGGYLVVGFQPTLGHHLAIKQ